MNVNVQLNKETLEAALESLRSKRENLNGQIEELEAVLFQTDHAARRFSSARSSPAQGVRRTMSEEAKMRIKAAQQKRWADKRAADARAHAAATEVVKDHPKPALKPRVARRPAAKKVVAAPETVPETASQA